MKVLLLMFNLYSSFGSPLLAKYASIGPVNTSKSCSGRLSLILWMKKCYKAHLNCLYVTHLTWNSPCQVWPWSSDPSAGYSQTWWCIHPWVGFAKGHWNIYKLKPNAPSPLGISIFTCRHCPPCRAALWTPRHPAEQGTCPTASWCKAGKGGFRYDEGRKPLYFSYYFVFDTLMSILYRSFPTLDIAISSPFFGFVSEGEFWDWIFMKINFTWWGSPLVEPGHHVLLLGDLSPKQHVDSLDVGGHGHKLVVTLQTGIMEFHDHREDCFSQTLTSFALATTLCS